MMMENEETIVEHSINDVESKKKLVSVSFQIFEKVALLVFWA